ncbi:TraB/GumN family protein [Xylophilus ampelinus]|uniref:TraB/GumN family protein n=1 Tax=Xylophilus ampelinus TaxID=54067 RepID=UPI0011B4BAC1|nr:TraB/GumN family protein [Xylophilus ampelinus]MCS4511458.1 TraB/GumN family protein [Xylophilus ampelinus]
MATLVPCMTGGWRIAAAVVLGAACIGAAVPAAAGACPPAPAVPGPAALAQMQAQAQDRGFLWRVGKSGRAGYLYGTVHVGRQAWAMPGPRLTRALLASQVLALELDPLDPTVQRRMAALATRHAGEWPPGMQARMRAQAARVCLPDAVQATLHPAMVLTTIELYALRSQKLYAEYAQEYVLSGWARARSVPVVSLETPEAQMRALVGSPDQVDAQALEDGLEALEQGRSAGVARTLTGIWSTSDLPRLANYAVWCGCMDAPRGRAQVEALLDDRNPALADGIDRLQAEGKPWLVAVGALHMIGPQGLPALLQERGYTVEYLPPAESLPKKAPAQNGKEP